MSFPYHQYVDYSNPATPRVYSWEVPTEQDALQMPPQTQDQPSVQQHQQPQQHQQQERVSPSQLQLHQLPPPPPPPHMTPQDVQQHLPQQQQQQQQPQQHQQQQQQTHQQAHFTPHPPTINLQPTTAQPQYRFDNITEEHFLQQQQQQHDARPGSSSSSTARRRGASKPPLHVDTSRTSPAGALSSAGLGPLRAPHTRAHTQSAHPYRRPQSRAASGSSTGTAGGAPVRTRRVSDMQAQAAAEAGAGAGAPTVGSAMAVSCPATDAWRGGLLGLSEGAGTSSVGQEPEATPNTTPRAIQALFAEPVRRYGIRADIHYSAEENLIVAMFELPGVKRGDLRITMSVCPFTRVRQVNIAGLSRSTLPAHGHGVRERKFGQFARTLVVPPETKPEDVQISLEDGILTLRIPGGTPVQTEAPQEIGVP